MKPCVAATGEWGRIHSALPKPTGGNRKERARQRASSGLLAGRPHFWHTASAGGAMKLLPQKLHLILTEEARIAERDDEDSDFLYWEGFETMVAAKKDHNVRPFENQKAQRCGHKNQFSEGVTN